MQSNTQYSIRGWAHRSIGSSGDRNPIMSRGEHQLITYQPNGCSLVLVRPGAWAWQPPSPTPPPPFYVLREMIKLAFILYHVHAFHSAPINFWCSSALALSWYSTTWSSSYPKVLQIIGLLGVYKLFQSILFFDNFCQYIGNTHFNL